MKLQSVLMVTGSLIIGTVFGILLSTLVAIAISATWAAKLPPANASSPSSKLQVPAATALQSSARFQVSSVMLFEKSNIAVIVCDTWTGQCWSIDDESHAWRNYGSPVFPVARASIEEDAYDKSAPKRDLDNLFDDPND